MSQLGLHAMVVTPEVSPRAIDEAVGVAASEGFDLLELPILDPGQLDAAHARAAATSAGLSLATSLGLSPETDVSSTDPATVEAGVQLLKKGVDVTADCGAERMCGVLASSLGRYSEPPTERGRGNAVAALREVSAHAEKRGIQLCLEMVNRYESNLVNTVRQGVDFVEAVGSDVLRLQIDTFHALIEEESLREAVVQAGELLAYVHVGQNDRGGLLGGTAPLGEFFDALREVQYGGPITFEAFSRATAPVELANTLAIWRSPWSDGPQLASEALGVLRELCHQD